MTRRLFTLWTLACAALVARAQEPGSTAPPPASTDPAPASSGPAPARSANPAPSVGPPRTPARVRPRTPDELHAAVAELTARGDGEGLLATCKDLKPFAEDPDSGPLLALCRGRGLQALARREEARAAFTDAVKLGTTGKGVTDRARLMASEARYRLAELAEAEWRDHRPCLRQLGIFWGSRAEATEEVRLLRVAEQAYRDAMPGARAPWGVRSAHRISSLHVDFYREVTGRTAITFRGLSGPPPLSSARVEQADEALKMVLDPARGDWPRMLREVAQAGLQFAERNQSDDPDLVAAARQLAASVSSIPPPARVPITSPFPPRGGNNRGMLRVVAERENVVFEDLDGKRRTEPVLGAGKLLVEMVKGGAAERFAPEAAVALGLGGYRAAIPVLEAAMAGTDRELAVAAVFALGEVGTTAQIPGLLAAYEQATEPGDTPEVFATAGAALFGMRERVLEALGKIGRREPRVMETLGKPLPPREVAWVLWQAAHKDLRYVYGANARAPDDLVAIYHALALVSVNPAEARGVLKELQNRKGTACWATHALTAMSRLRDKDGTSNLGPPSTNPLSMP